MQPLSKISKRGLSIDHEEDELRPNFGMRNSMEGGCTARVVNEEIHPLLAKRPLLHSKKAMFCFMGLKALPFAHDRFRLPKPNYGVIELPPPRKSVFFNRPPLPPPLTAVYKAPLEPIVAHYPRPVPYRRPPQFPDEDYIEEAHDDQAHQLDGFIRGLMIRLGL